MPPTIVLVHGSFAEELSKTEPQFDRLEFIEAITREPA
jgi:hypothetical protein